MWTAHVPQRLAMVTKGHEDGILAGLADRVELLQQELDELGLLLLGDLGKAVDDDKGVVALLELDLIFLLEIRHINLVVVEILLVEVLVAQSLIGRRHAGQTLSRLAGSTAKTGWGVSLAAGLRCRWTWSASMSVGIIEILCAAQTVVGFENGFFW